MKTAVISSSLKMNEKRVPIHPDHLKQLDHELLTQLVFEKNYGLNFGISDEKLKHMTGSECQSKEDLLANYEQVIMTKPTLDDLKMMKDRSILFGWIHSVQNPDIVDIAQAKKMTLVAWENMYHENKRGRVHLFQTNNELAGYCAVQHALLLKGMDGYYGPQRSIKIISFGSVSRGAIHALMSHGFYDIEVFSWRPSHLIADQIHALTYSQMYFDSNHDLRVNREGKPYLSDILASSDIIVNGILQNPVKPVMFIKSDDLEKFTHPTLIIDVSCDEGMGFPFAIPTDFDQPILHFDSIDYYAVDHTPTLLWDSATYQISKSLLPYLNQFIFNNYGEVLEHAVDVREGKIVNNRINEFQNR